ncbi:hypothetical protein ABTN31_19215, partial [Acinetobacter baumannii]
DLGFRIRRLRLLARRLTEIEEDYAEEELAPIREAIYGALARYLEGKRTETHAHLGRDVRAMNGNAAILLERLAGSLNLKALDDET